MEEAYHCEAFCRMLEEEEKTLYFWRNIIFLKKKPIFTRILKEASVVSQVINNIHKNYIPFEKDNNANNSLEKKNLLPS